MKAKAVIRIGPEAQPGRFERGRDRILALVTQHLGELDDQDGVLRGQPDQHDQADLREDVVHVALRRPPRHAEAEVRAEGRERRPEEHAERQRPALVLRREHEEHQEDREREDDHRVRRALLLVRHVGPVVAHLGGQHLLGDFLERGQRLRRAVAGRRHAGDLGRAIQVEAVGELRAARRPRRHQRVERHHLAVACPARRTGRTASGRAGTPARPARTPCRRARTC